MSFNFTVGCDPELFIEEKGKVVSGHGVIKGTKTEPFAVKDGAVQVDGTALEFNTVPAQTEDEFCTNISTVMNELRKLVPSEYKYSLRIENLFEKEYFETLPEEAKELGCNPDMNAWTGMEQVAEERMDGMRTTAGHVHIGWREDDNPDTPDHMHRCKMFAKQLDYSLGVYSVINEKPNTRRMMYGQAGSYRRTPYGLEYRVPSNFYIFNEIHRRNVYRIVQKAGNDLVSGKAYFGDAPSDGTLVDAINNDDKELCNAFFKQFESSAGE